MVELLINGGADVNAKNDDNRTPLHFAMIRGTPKIVEMLIKNGANVNAQTKSKETPLHGVANGDSDKHYAIAELLLNNGADVNLKDTNDKTPLDVAKNEKSKFRIALFFNLISLNQFYFLILCFVVKELLQSKMTTN